MVLRYGWDSWVGGLLTIALFWVGLTAVIYLVARAIGGGGGEISTGEFEERRGGIERHAA